MAARHMQSGELSARSWRPFIHIDLLRFPPVPKPALLLMKYGLWWVHSDMWAFACCDKNSVLKPEFAAYEPDTEE